MPKKLEHLDPGARRAEGELETLPLSELSDRLPYGAALSEPTFLFSPPTFGTRKKQGAVRTRKDLARHPARATIYWLVAALRRLGGVDLPAKEDEAALVVAKLSFGDVLFLLLRWQVESYPDGYPVGAASCGHCGGEMAGIRIDLGAAPITIRKGGAGAVAVEVGLRRGFPVGRGTVKVVRLEPPTFFALWNLGTEGWANPEALRGKLLADAIVATDLEGIDRVPEAALDELWPEDLALVDEALAAITPTPDLEVEVPCPHCGGKNSTTIEWRNIPFGARS